MWGNPGKAPRLTEEQRKALERQQREDEEGRERFLQLVAEHKKWLEEHPQSPVTSEPESDSSGEE